MNLVNETGPDITSEAMRFRGLCRKLSKYLFKVYGLRVVQKEQVDMPEYIGSFNGRLITIKTAVKPEHKFFLMVHLFGHCVQWCGPRSATYSDIALTLPLNNGGKMSAAQLSRLYEYELEAAGYGLKLLTDVFDTDLTQWFANWVRADWDYFTKIVDLSAPRTQELNVKDGAELIAVRGIPKIKLKEIAPQYAY